MEMACPALVCWSSHHSFVLGVAGVVVAPILPQGPEEPYGNSIHSYGSSDHALLLLEEVWEEKAEGEEEEAALEAADCAPRIPAWRKAGEPGVAAEALAASSRVWALLRRISSSHKYLWWNSRHHNEHHHWGAQSSFSLRRSLKIIE